MEAKKHAAIKRIKEFWNVPVATEDNLQKFVDLLLSSNQKYNLIGKSTEEDIWNRHILDSAQLLKYVDDVNLVTADFGTGAGFPGLVLSILGIKEVHLIEKSFRKCEFLEEAKKISPNKVVVHQKNIEELSDLKFDLVTSRALAPLSPLLSMIKPFMKEDSQAIFLKGKNLPSELNLAKKNNKFIYTSHPSLTSNESAVIIIKNLN